MNNRDRLIEIMIDQGLERRELAELVRVERNTLDDWLAPAESSRHVEVPDMAIELLELKLDLESRADPRDEAAPDNE